MQAQARTSLANVAETAMDGSAVVLTVYGYKQLVTMEEFAGMPITEFAKLYTVSLQPILAFSAPILVFKNGLLTCL